MGVEQLQIMLQGGPFLILFFKFFIGIKSMRIRAITILAQWVTEKLADFSVTFSPCFLAFKTL
jgi:hypothetical protein